MATADLSKQTSIDTTNDSIVIVHNMETIPGGKTLDVTGWGKTTIPAGHPIILDDDGEYKPIALDSNDEIDTANAAKTVGILVATILTESPLAAIMVRGTVNKEAAVYAIPAACQSPLSLIRFMSE